MTLHSSNKSSSANQPPFPSDVKKTSPKAQPIPIVGQSDMQELTPLQRQRLDTAVMLLVNYLVSASSQA